MSVAKKFFLKVGAVLAVVLHPCFLFFYVFLVVHFNVPHNEWNHKFWLIFAVVLGLTVILPALFPIIYAKDAFLKDRKKRPLTLLFTLVCYVGCYIWMVSFLHEDSYMDDWLNQLGIYVQLLPILISGLFLVFIVSFWYKISLHANGMGFLLAIFAIVATRNTFLHNGSIIFIGLILNVLCGILLWQRVASGAHTFWQVASGFLAGFIVTFLIFMAPMYYATSVIPGWHTVIESPWGRYGW